MTTASGARALVRANQVAQINHGVLVAGMTHELIELLGEGHVADDEFVAGYLLVAKFGHERAAVMMGQFVELYRGIQAPGATHTAPVLAAWDAGAAYGRAMAALRELQAPQTSQDVAGEFAVTEHRHALNAGRETMEYSCAANGTRWRRVTDGNPCAFCAMLATRSDYRTRESALRVVGRANGYKTAQYKATGQIAHDQDRQRGTRPLGSGYHDHCGCTVAEVIGEWEPTDREREYADLYDRAVAKCQADGVPATPENITKAMRELGQGVVHDAATPPSGEGPQSKSGAQPNSNSTSGPDTQTGGTGGGGGQPPKRGTMQPDEDGGYPRPDDYRGRADDPRFDALLAEKVIRGIESDHGKMVGGHGYGQTPVGKNNTEFPKHWTDADIAAAFYETLQYGTNLGDGWSVRMEHEVNGILCELRFSRDSAHPEESVGFYPLSGAGVVKVSWLKGKRREQVTR